MNTLIIILSATLLCLSYGTFISPRPETELYLIRLRIELLTRQLHDACPHLVNHGLFLGKRSAGRHLQTMEMEREIHNHILHLLNRCFQEKETTKPRTTTTQTTSTETTSTETTSTETTSTETTSTETTSTETTSTETTSTETTSTETTSTETTSTEATSTPSTTTQTTTTQKTSTHTTSPQTTSTQMTSTPFWCWGWTVNYRVPTKPSTTTTQTTSTETNPTVICTSEPASTEKTSTEKTSTETTSTETAFTETTSTPSTTTQTTTTQMTSTPFWWWTTNYMVQLPWQCTSSSTRNLTESWRNNSPQVYPLNDDTGVLDSGRTWFRFIGRAGNLLKSTCPDVYSCGSDGAFWSDSSLPYCPGETRSITLYESYWQVGQARGRCSVRSFRGKATRCSMERGGVVYRMDDAFSGGSDTICGMY